MFQHLWSSERIITRRAPQDINLRLSSICKSHCCTVTRVPVWAGWRDTSSDSVHRVPWGPPWTVYILLTSSMHVHRDNTTIGQTTSIPALHQDEAPVLESLPKLQVWPQPPITRPGLLLTYWQGRRNPGQYAVIQDRVRHLRVLKQYINYSLLRLVIRYNTIQTSSEWVVRT